MNASRNFSTAPAGGPPPRGLPWRPLALLVLFLAGAGAYLYALAQERSALELQTIIVEQAGPAPVDRIRLRDHASSSVQILLLHGYAGNRRQLRPLAQVLAAAGAEVFVPDLPGRGDHPAPASPLPPAGASAAMATPQETEAAIAVVHHLLARHGLRPERLVLVGHSLGGGVALDLAARFSPAAAVTLAGLERAVRPDQPRNLLLVSARLDVSPLVQAADRMYQNARRGIRTTPVERRTLFATHTGLPFSSAVQRLLVDWINRSVPDAQLEIPAHYNLRLRALAWGALFFLGALFVPLAGLAAWALNAEPLGEVIPETRLRLWTPWQLGAYAVAAGVVTVALLHALAWRGWPHPLAFLRLHNGDYLASFLLLATPWLLPAFWRGPWVRDWRETARKAGSGLLLALYVIVVVGGFLTWQAYDLWPTLARTLKLLVLVPALFPYAMGEELLVRHFARNERGVAPLSAFLIWRLALLVTIVAGAAFLDTGQAMLFMLALPLVLLSLAQFFFATVLYRVLGSVYATAALNALLTAWILATIFPLR